MSTTETSDIKEVVKQKYGEAALRVKSGGSSCCGATASTGCCDPITTNLYDLAQALELAGKTDDASKAFAEFEQKSLLESNRGDNSNHELIFYYADHAKQPEKALEVAKREIARRHDVFTLDSYAWALYGSGQYPEARKQIETALAVGIRDAKIFRHAGEIALKSGDSVAAERYLKESAALNTVGSNQARITLASLAQEVRR